MAQALFTDFEIRPVVSEIETYGVAVVHGFVPTGTCDQLLQELGACDWRDVLSHKGKRGVRQEFKAAMQFNEDSPVLAFRDLFQHHLNEQFAECRPNPLSRPLEFNWVVAQRYSPGWLGIGPHRDEAFFHGVIALLVLEGDGGLWLCEDYEKTNAAPVPNRVGTLILLRATGFADSKERPIHYVSRVSWRRTVLAFRHIVR